MSDEKVIKVERPQMCYGCGKFIPEGLAWESISGPMFHPNDECPKAYAARINKIVVGKTVKFVYSDIKIQ